MCVPNLDWFGFRRNVMDTDRPISRPSARMASAWPASVGWPVQVAPQCPATVCAPLPPQWPPAGVRSALRVPAEEAARWHLRRAVAPGALRRQEPKTVVEARPAPKALQHGRDRKPAAPLPAANADPHGRTGRIGDRHRRSPHRQGVARYVAAVTFACPTRVDNLPSIVLEAQCSGGPAVGFSSSVRTDAVGEPARLARAPPARS